jgi:UDPglucose--hexose-1-phosphate uridylyltransferase
MAKKQIHEFRKDLVSGDWILVAPGRQLRLRAEKQKLLKKIRTVKSELADCPFENPQKSGNPLPFLWYPRPETPIKKRKDLSSWFVQVFPNKYPLLFNPLKKTCPPIQSLGPWKTLKGIGFHEVIITRDHFKTIDKMSLEEVELLIRAYQTRCQTLASEPCINYILIFHNQGQLAGASLSHPHSQLVALPVVDPDISKSLEGSQEYYEKRKKCIHCAMLEWEMKQKKRIVYKNKHFVTLVPFASRVSYETRIYPLAHAAHFEEISDEKRRFLAESLRDALKRIAKAIKTQDYNFFIHSAPINLKNHDHYHWHVEILPRVSSWAGLELGVGIEAIVIPPEEAAKDLRKAK